MAWKTYFAEFRRDAVELCRTTPGATVVGIAGDLGIMASTLSARLKAAGVQVHWQPGSRSSRHRIVGRPRRKLVRLRSRVAALEADARKLYGQRDILRAAAKYFAGETRW